MSSSYSDPKSIDNTSAEAAFSTVVDAWQGRRRFLQAAAA